MFDVIVNYGRDLISVHRGLD